MKKALILGITGQDGSYLSEILLSKNYSVHGMVRRSSTGNLCNIQHNLDKLILHNGDMSDPLSVQGIIADVKPDEIYNEADQDHVGYSYDTPAYSGDITGSAVGRLLEIVRQWCPTAKVFIPLSATMFGNAPAPQNTDTPFNPQSPYAVSKVAAYYWAKYYREHHGMFVTSAILYNHDSVRRTGDYLLHKLARQAVALKLGQRTHIELGNYAARIDIGHAFDYMNVAYSVMQQENPVSILIGTGRAITIHEMALSALLSVGFTDECSLEAYLKTDTKFMLQSPTLIADIGSINTWQVNSNTTSVEQIIKSLVEHYGAKS